MKRENIVDCYLIKMTIYPFERRKNMISVEYSKSQKCLHVDDLQKVLKINREKFLLNKDNDWEIIAVF